MFNKDTNILVVDDSYNIRQIICDNLHRMGFSKIVTAEDANEAFGKLNYNVTTPQAFNLILSDLNMPGPSGLDFLRQVRTHEQFKHIPFILITTEAEKSAVIEAATSGVSAYIVKPFNLETLSKRLQEAWKKHNK